MNPTRQVETGRAGQWGWVDVAGCAVLMGTLLLGTTSCDGRKAQPQSVAPERRPAVTEPVKPAVPRVEQLELALRPASARERAESAIESGRRDLARLSKVHQNCVSDQKRVLHETVRPAVVTP